MRLLHEYETWCDAHASVDENSFEEEHVIETDCATTLEEDGQLAGTDKECYELLKQLKSQSALLDSTCPTKAGSEFLVKDDISDEGDVSVTSGKKILTLSALFEKLQRKSTISQSSVLSEMWHLVIALREGPGCDGEYIKSHRSSVASIVHLKKVCQTIRFIFFEWSLDVPCAIEMGRK